MILRKFGYSTSNPAALLTAFACLLFAGCGGDDPPQAATAPPDPLALYPTVRTQNAAPSATDFIQDAELGALLTATVGGQQLTLYTFGNDTAGTSNCTINPDST